MYWPARRICSDYCKYRDEWDSRLNRERWAVVNRFSEPTCPLFIVLALFCISATRTNLCQISRSLKFIKAVELLWCLRFRTVDDRTKFRWMINWVRCVPRWPRLRSEECAECRVVLLHGLECCLLLHTVTTTTCPGSITDHNVIVRECTATTQGHRDTIGIIMIMISTNVSMRSAGLV